MVDRMLRTSGRRLDLCTPFVDALLPDGSRLHVVIPDFVSNRFAGSHNEDLLDWLLEHRRSSAATA